MLIRSDCQGFYINTQEVPSYERASLLAWLALWRCELDRVRLELYLEFKREQAGIEKKCGVV